MRHGLKLHTACFFPFCMVLQCIVCRSSDAYECCSVQADTNGQDHGSIGA
jgi:hypothetical protein